MDDVLAPALTVVVVEAVDDNNAAIIDLTGIEMTLTDERGCGAQRHSRVVQKRLLARSVFSLENVLMTTSAIITMVLILGFIWGGFFLALSTAVRKESDKGD